jgi:hypothetical protein
MEQNHVEKHIHEETQKTEVWDVVDTKGAHYSRKILKTELINKLKYNQGERHYITIRIITIS